MSDTAFTITAGLLGLGTGVFVVLSLIEKPVWSLMWAPQSPRVPDAEARAVHAVLKRVIHLLPPIMMTTMAAASASMIALVVLSGASLGSLALAALFFFQLALIVARLRHDIRGVDEVASDGEARLVRAGLGQLALLHHRGLLMTGGTLVALLVLRAFA